MIPSHSKILVIGGGPAGTTAATFLAREGHEVVLFEKDFFPRYHIGESLLVSVQETLQLLGLKERVTAHGFLQKTGAILNWGDEKWNFDWSKLPGTNKSSFQVKRDEFDDILIKYTVEKGTKVFEGVTVNSLKFDGDKPISANYTKRGKEDSNEKVTGDITFDWLIDASGRTGIMSNKYLKSRVYNNAFKNIAIWAYWRNVKKPDTGILRNPILINSIQNGWNWTIPLHDGTTSIGVVMRHDYFQQLRETKSKKEIYDEVMKESGLVMDLLVGATQVSEVHSEGDYSYHSNIVAGERYFMCGDAACFLDPLLSTGCHLAMYSATLAAASILSTYRGEVSEEEARNFYSTSYLKHFTRWVIVVGSLSNIRAGKESYFWSAQSLITEEIQANDKDFGETIRQSFSKMVSGMEDIKESQDLSLFSSFSDKLNKKLQSDPNNSSFPFLAMNMIDEQLSNAEKSDKPASGGVGVGIEVGSLAPHFVDGKVGNIQMVSEPRLGLFKTSTA